MLTKEKEELIRKLLREGYTNREITKIAHCSPNEITPIRRKIIDENTEDSINTESKSMCSRALDLFRKEVDLIDMIIILDIEPELGKKYHDIYLGLIEREKIVTLLKDVKDPSLEIDILEFLQKNPQLFQKIKQATDIQVVIWELIAKESEAQHDLEITNFLLKHAESRLKKLNEELS